MDPLVPCKNDDELHEWLKIHVGLDVPRTAVCQAHHAPFEYVHGAYFEPAKDMVVWAPRGGGKTRLAAAVSLLDLMHKPGTSIRILGGSLDQAMRMWEYLIPDLERLAPQLLEHAVVKSRSIRFQDGSSIAVLTQSQRAVRGLRIQKLRCDEVELFKPDIWEAAQLVTRSLPKSSGTVEAISTLHAPWGLMSRIVDKARENGTTVVRWCLLDVLERCPPERPCETCLLWNECNGTAKTRCSGFIPIDDAIAMKKRVSLETWESEMLCQRPSVRGSVFPHFDLELHVREAVAPGRLYLGIDFGFASPFVCLWIVLCADGMTLVIDEYMQPGRVMHEHLEQIRLRPWGQPWRVMCDPAGHARNDQTARSNVQELRDAGYVVRTRHSHVNDGVELMRAALCPASGPPTLRIHPRCVRLIRAMQGYHYSERGGESPFKDGEHDHFVDALRYYFVNRSKEVIITRMY